MNDQNMISREESSSLVEEFLRRSKSLPPPTAAELEAREARRQAATKSIVDGAARADAERRYLEACLPEFRDSNWDFPEIAPFRRQIDRILAYQVGPRGLLASGPSGRRKTGAMWALMRRLVFTEGRDVRFWSAHDFFSALQRQVHFGNDEAGSWIDTVARRPLVFIDDYGQHALQKSREEWAESWFFRFLDLRAGLHLPLFLTTNLTGEALGSNGGARGDPLLRRLLMVCEPVPFETPAEETARLNRNRRNVR